MMEIVEMVSERSWEVKSARANQGAQIRQILTPPRSRRIAAYRSRVDIFRSSLEIGRYLEAIPVSQSQCFVCADILCWEKCIDTLPEIAFGAGHVPGILVRVSRFTKRYSKEIGLFHRAVWLYKAIHLMTPI